MPKTVTEAYRIISQGLLDGFKALGLEAYYAVPKTEADRENLKNPRSGVCFDAPSWYEIVVEGRKSRVVLKHVKKVLSYNTVLFR